MKKVEAFLGKPDLANLTNYEVIRINKQKERNDRVKRISDYVRMALESADIYVRGEKVTTKAKDVVARINEAFGKLVASEFSKLGDRYSCNPPHSRWCLHWRRMQGEGCGFRETG